MCLYFRSLIFCLQVTWADFVLFSALEVVDHEAFGNVGGACTDSAVLQAYMKNIREIPAIAKYLADRPDTVV